MKDAYWSLWGKLKARLAKDQDIELEVEAMHESGVNLYDEIAGEILDEWWDMGRPELRLPKRNLQVELEADGTTNVIVLKIEDKLRSKAVTSDNHAAAFLRKVDNDDSYFESLLQQEQPS